MKNMCYNRLLTFLLAVTLLVSTSCSPTSYSSQEGMFGALAGTLVGSGVGWWFGDQYGKMTENILINSAIGGGIGLLAGALLHDQNIKVARKREVVEREAAMLDENQVELDLLRERLYDSTSWGGNETKPWNERYLDEDPQHPYLGPTGYTR